MKTTTFIGAALPLILTGAASMTGSAHGISDSSSVNTSLPPLQWQGQTLFLTGGIGKDESDSILHQGRSWPLMLELAQAATPRAVYISDVQVIIKDAAGN